MPPTAASHGDLALPSPALPPGERRRFEELTLPFLPDLYRLAVRLRGDSRDVEDLSCRRLTSRRSGLS